MGPTQYRELKRQKKLFNDGEKVKTIKDTSGVIQWIRWDIAHCEWFANVVYDDGTAEYFWHSELSKNNN